MAVWKGLPWMPSGVHFEILAMMTSPLKGRKTTRRNSANGVKSDV